jgi:hypothetical protein
MFRSGTALSFSSAVRRRYEEEEKVLQELPERKALQEVP